MTIGRLLALTLFSCLPMLAQAFDTVLVNQNYLNLSIAEYSDYLSPTDEDLSILDVTKESVERQFSPIHGDSLNFNQLADSTWITFSTNNPTGRPVRLFVSVEAPFLSRVELYSDITSSAGYNLVASGEEVSYQNRPFQMGRYVLPVTLDNGLQQLYLKVSPTVATNMRFHLMDETALLAESRTQVQITTLLTCVLLATAAVSLLGYSRFKMPLSLWAGVSIVGITVNIAGWNGSISYILTGIPAVAIVAINAGAFLTIMGLAHVLHLIRNETYTNWLSDALVWVGRIFLILTLLALSPLANSFLPMQIILIPVGLTIFALYLFEHRPATQSERLTLISLVLFAVYFVFTTLALIGLISAFNLFNFSLSILGLLSAIVLCWATWIAAKAKGARVAMEGLSLPDIHWPLLRKINHEMRGPINGVMGMTELLQDTTLSAHQQEYVNTVQTAGFSLLREADQLQNLIRIGLNRLPESEDEFDLYDLIEDTVQPFSRVSHAKKLELVLDIAPEIPSHYRGNAHIISQILANLIDNALKFTEHGEVLLQVKPWHHNRVRFAITDTGPGISGDLKNQMFSFPDPHNTHQQQPKDVHLGLPISKYLVSLLGGQLTYSSEQRMGTTFWVDLPLVPIHNAEQQQTPKTGLDIEDLRLMVVDDNLTCRKVIEHLAMNWNADVLSMSNGQSALANLHNQFHKGEPVDVLILDQNMPSMTGFELAQRIRQDSELNKDIVIIMMTGTDDVSATTDSSDTGIEFVLSKPVSARALLHTLNLAMTTIRQNREKHHAQKTLFF